MEKILIAKPVIKQIYTKIKLELDKYDISPVLKILIIGKDPAAEYYVNNLKKKGVKVGIKVEVLNFEENINSDVFCNKIQEMNEDKNVDGIMIQKPFPADFDENKVINSINPDKDVDGFHPLNMGKLLLDKAGFLPSTAEAVLAILEFYRIETAGKRVTILGRSNIVGKPLANLLLRKNKTGDATVTVCHSRSEDLEKITTEADILIAAIGKADFVKANMIKEGCILIDVGINQIEEPDSGLKYVGDVDFKDCLEKCRAITPVPGGVGSVTTALLLHNVLKAFLNKKGL